MGKNFRADLAVLNSFIAQEVMYWWAEPPALSDPSPTLQGSTPRQAHWVSLFVSEIGLDYGT